MATTPNYGWVTPAPTDFVTDLPADFEVFADEVDADLAGLLGGTTGQVLTKASNADHDFAFATPPAAPALEGYTLLNTGGTALTGSGTITVSGISNKTKLIILAEDVSSANASATFTLRFNSDTGSNYRFGGLLALGASTVTSAQLSGTGGGTQTSFTLCRMSDNAASQAWIGVSLSGGTSTDFKRVSGTAGASAPSASNSQFLAAWEGIYLGTSAISSVSLISSSGNFDGGTIFVFGSD
jgi:hypothetical protein